MSSLVASMDLPPTVHSIRAARHLVLHLLRAWRAPNDADDAALLVTELVANVVDHVGGEASFTVELRLADGRLRISVADGSSVPPVVRELDRHSPRGRGMRIVQAIADRWGSEDVDGGKRVWLELSPRRHAVGGLPSAPTGEGPGEEVRRTEGNRAMSEPSNQTQAAGEGLSDEEMVETVAGQTDSASEHADVAGKDWNGDPGSAPAPEGQ